MFLLSLGLSAGLLVAFNVLAFRSGGLGRSLILSLIVCPVAFSCLTFPLALHAFCLCLAAGFAFPMGRRGVVTASCLATVAAYFGLYWFHIRDEQSQWKIAQEQYPLESLAQRLAYEGHPGRVPAHLPDGPEERHQATNSRLELLEGSLQSPDAQRRADSLKLAHASAVEQFISSPGFGHARTLAPSPFWIRARHWNDYPVPQGQTHLWLDLDGAKPEYPTPPGVSLTHTGSRDAGLWGIHRDGLLEFLDPNSFGYVLSRDRAAGFLAHHFRQVPPGWRGDRGKAQWLLERLELVSLLKHDKPAVYLSDTLPKMSEVGDYKTRPLDAFESSVLPLLQAGEDLSKQLKEKELRLLGSIRATKQCLKCHDAKRGDLLGAFTYKLRRESAPQ